MLGLGKGEKIGNRASEAIPGTSHQGVRPSLSHAQKAKQPAISASAAPIYAMAPTTAALAAPRRARPARAPHRPLQGEADRGPPPTHRHN